MLETLVVEGDLWKTPISQTAASVTVLDTATLEQATLTHFEDAIAQIPNLTWSGGTARPRYLQIRGIGENSQFEGETPDSTVRFLVDDIDLTGLAGVASFLDMEQIEVLRGPQAGAFGANAAAGLIYLRSAAPGGAWNSYAETTIAEDSLLRFSVATGGDVSESLGIRLAIQQETANGFRDNLTLGENDTNGIEETTARLKLGWSPNDNWQWDATLLYANANNGYDSFALDNNGSNTFSDEPGEDDQETWGGSLRGSFTGWNDVALTTITSGTSTDSLYSYDADWTDASYGGFSRLDRERAVISQELRFDSIDQEDALGWIDRWTFGVFFQDLSEDTTGSYRDLFTPESSFDTVYDAQTVSIYAQGSHQLSERTEITLGLRAEHYSLDTETQFRTSEDFSDTLWGGKISIQHAVSDTLRLFASTTRGYKAGGVNIYPFLEADDPLTYETETLWNYEVGVRAFSEDGHISAALTAFYLDRDTPQVRDSAGFGGSFRFFTDNGDSAHISGLETDLRWAITDAWTLTATAGILDSELDTFTLANGLSAGGRELAATPRYTFSTGLAYASGDESWFGNVIWSGRSDYFQSNSHDAKLSSFTVVNGSIGYAFSSLRVSLWVKNLFDTEYEERVFFFGNDPDIGFEAQRYISAADPRQIGVSARLDW